MTASLRRWLCEHCFESCLIRVGYVLSRGTVSGNSLRPKGGRLGSECYLGLSVFLGPGHHGASQNLLWWFKGSSGMWSGICIDCVLGNEAGISTGWMLGDEAWFLVDKSLSRSFVGP